MLNIYSINLYKKFKVILNWNNFWQSSNNFKTITNRFSLVMNKCFKHQQKICQLLNLICDYQTHQQRNVGSNMNVRWWVSIRIQGRFLSFQLRLQKNFGFFLTKTFFGVLMVLVSLFLLTSFYTSLIPFYTSLIPFYTS